MKKIILLFVIAAALSGCSKGGKTLLESDTDYYKAMISLNNDVDQNVWDSIGPALDAIKVDGSDYRSTNESLEKAYKKLNGYIEKQEGIEPTPHTDDNHKLIHEDMLVEKKALEALIKYSETGDRQPFINISQDLSDSIEQKYRIIKDYTDQLNKMESAK